MLSYVYTPLLSLTTLTYMSFQCLHQLPYELQRYSTASVLLISVSNSGLKSVHVLKSHKSIKN
jgi:hypothetical protein